MRTLAGVFWAVFLAFGPVRPVSALTPWMRKHPEASWNYLKNWERRHEWFTPRREGRLMFESERLAEAEAFLERALAEGGADGALFYELGYCRWATGRPAEAFELMGKAAAWYAGNRPGHLYHFNSLYLRAGYLEETGRPEEALAEYAAAEALSPGSGALLLKMAGLNLELGRTEEALSGLGRIPPEDPGAAAAAALAASIHFEKGDLEQAARELARAGEEPFALYLSGQISARRGDPGSALALYDLALKSDPDLRGARIAAANLAYSEGDLGGARARFLELVRREPGEARWRYNLGVILREAGEGGSEEYLRQARELDPSLAAVSVPVSETSTLVSELLRSGDFGEAERISRFQLEEDPFRVPARFNLALALQGQGRVGPAILQYERILRIVPDHAPAHLNRALLALERKDSAAAARHFRRYLDLDPGSPQEAEIRLRLRRLRGW